MLYKFQNILKTVSYTICLILLFTFSSNALAVDSIKAGFNETATQSGFVTTTSNTTVPTVPTVATIIGQIVGLALSLLGVLFMVLIVYAGFMWMTARGNEENAQKAREIMINATIGAIIIFSAYILSNWIIKNLYNATNT